MRWLETRKIVNIYLTLPYWMFVHLNSVVQYLIFDDMILDIANDREIIFTTSLLHWPKNIANMMMIILTECTLCTYVCPVRVRYRENWITSTATVIIPPPSSTTTTTPPATTKRQTKENEMQVNISEWIAPFIDVMSMLQLYIRARCKAHYKFCHSNVYTQCELHTNTLNFYRIFVENECGWAKERASERVSEWVSRRARDKMQRKTSVLIF